MSGKELHDKVVALVDEHTGPDKMDKHEYIEVVGSICDTLEAKIEATQEELNEGDED